MHILRGRSIHTLSEAELTERLAHYREVMLDIGTGDGRYVQHIARNNPARFVIGGDACRENLREASRQAAHNTLFVIANAEALPAELRGVAQHISINFPWGSLLDGLLTGHAGLLEGLIASGQPGAPLDIRLNGGALAQAGTSLEAGGMQVRQVLRANGFRVAPLATLQAADLRACPTTWAHRLAWGRDPRALLLRAFCPVSSEAIKQEDLMTR